MVAMSKTLFLKFANVTPDELAALHQRSEELLELLPHEPKERAMHYGHEPDWVRSSEFVKILSSKLNPEDKTYVVEVRINAAIECWISKTHQGGERGTKRLCLAPRVVLLHLLTAFEGLFPENIELLTLPDPKL